MTRTMTMTRTTNLIIFHAVDALQDCRVSFDSNGELFLAQWTDIVSRACRLDIDRAKNLQSKEARLA